MKSYLILKDFNGTQGDNAPAKLFKAGQVAPLSDSLAAALGGVTGEYLKDPVTASEEISNAPPELAAPVIEAITEAATDGEDEDSVDPEDRETKVIEPAETKPARLSLRKK